MTTFNDVEDANLQLHSSRGNLEIIKKTFTKDHQPESKPYVGRFNQVNIPEHLRQTFGVLLISHFEEKVKAAEELLETVAHDLKAAQS